MDIGGYNKGKIEDLGSKIADIGKQVANKVTDTIEQGFIKPMSRLWYAPEAVEEFNGVQAAVETLADSLQDAYNNYVSWIESMGSVWASATGGVAPTIARIAGLLTHVDVSSIKEEDGGNITLDETQAVSLADTMASLRQQILAEVRAKHAALTAAAAFIGHGQDSAAKQCFDKVADAIGDLFKMLETFGERIHEYADKYQKIGEEIASNLNSATMSVSGN